MSEDSKGTGHSLWGGRFSAKPSEVMRAINASISFDKRLAIEDLTGSRAHAAMLAARASFHLRTRPQFSVGSVSLNKRWPTGPSLFAKISKTFT